MAERFLNLTETPGVLSHPQILTMLQLDDKWPQDDSVPWCSGFVNYICWLLNLPRTKSLAARSWLKIPNTIGLSEAVVGFDIVIFSRGSDAPPATVFDAPGHVGFYGGIVNTNIMTLGGNQGDRVSLAPYAKSRLLGIRRLHV